MYLTLPGRTGGICEVERCEPCVSPVTGALGCEKWLLWFATKELLCALRPAVPFTGLVIEVHSLY